MTPLRRALVLFGVLIVLPMIANAAFQTQRDQIFVSIIINVTPAPLVMRPRSASPAAAIAVGLKLDSVAQPRRVFQAQSLAFAASPSLLAQNQGSVRVEASISPNPTATMLYGNNCNGQFPVAGSCSGWTISQTAGTTQVYTCAYEVVVDTKVNSWTLDHGLYSNFAINSGSGSFPGGDLANNTHIATPHPTATPFQVYLTDGGVWPAAGTGNLMKTFCVDLTLTIPATTAQGTYSSNAVYTLYY